MSLFVTEPLRVVLNHQITILCRSVQPKCHLFLLLSSLCSRLKRLETSLVTFVKVSLVTFVEDSPVIFVEVSLVTFVEDSLVKICYLHSLYRGSVYVVPLCRGFAM